MKKISLIIALILACDFAAGQECEFYWSNIPTLSSNHRVATGVINGVTYTYASSEAVEFSDGVFDHYLFPASHKIPNQKCIRNSKITKNILEFENPVKDPVLVFASIGNIRTIVPVIFQQRIEILFEKGIIRKDGKNITGQEGFAIVLVPGMHSKIEFEYAAEEYYANFIFGAAICKPCDFTWSGIPEIAGNTARGQIGGIHYTYTSSKPVQFTNSLFEPYHFPKSLNLPNQKCIRNDEVTDNVLEFERPLQDPVLVFSSIGNMNQTVPISFKQDFIIEFQKGIISVNQAEVTGREGFLVLRFPGLHKKIEFSYLKPEYYANFLFGAAACE